MATDVPGVISQAQDTAAALAKQAGDMVSRSMLAYDTRYEFAPLPLELSVRDVDFVIGAPPAYNGEHFIAPAEPGAMPDMLPLPDLEVGEAPALRAEKPRITEPRLPAQLAQFYGQAPSLSGISVPAAPAALQSLNITPPELSEIHVPGAPVVQAPEFTAVRPLTDLPDPGDLAAQYRQDFTDQSSRMARTLDGELDAYLAKINPQFHSQMAAIEDRLSKYLAGGTGFRPEVEDAIWNRAADKTNAEFLRLRDTAYADAARRGFTLPSGAVHSSVMQARQAAADANARAAMDIAIKQAEIEQANLQFAVTQSVNLRQVALQSTQAWAGSLVQLNAQALQFAQGILQAAIALYDLRVKIVQARVQIYQAEAEVYQYRLKAVLAVYDIYQAQIEGLKAQVSVDAAKVQAFSAQASAYGALANAYKAVIDGVATKAQIEKLKVESFGAEVNAYQARVQAKAAEWQGYKAQLEGQMTRVEAYKAEVQAYGQEVDAFKARVQAKSTQIQAVSSANEAAARTYQAAVAAYGALVQGRSEAVRAEINSYESTIKAWTAGVQAQEAKARVRIAINSAVAQTTISAYQQQTQTAISNAQMNYQRMADVAKVASSGADVYARMASSALSGMNALAASSEVKSL